MAGQVWIVIVNYRTASLAVDCLYSVAAQVSELPMVRALVVDNSSGDGSVEKLMKVIDQEGWNSWARVLVLDRNGGFAFGNNAGIREALRPGVAGDYVMLLNPDTILHKGAIRSLVDFMDTHPPVGIAGSRLENANGAVEYSAHNSISPLGELESSAHLGLLSRLLHRYAVTPPPQKVDHECDWVSGASLIVRRQVFEDIGLLDERYFLYFEEADFCVRARNAGWKVWFVPESHVVHLEGASTGIRDSTRRRPRYWYESRRRYFVKHFGIPGLILADVLWAAGRASFTLRRALRIESGGYEVDPKWFAFDLLWGDLRSLFTRELWEV